MKKSENKSKKSGNKMKKSETTKIVIPSGGLKCRVCSQAGFNNSYKLNAHLFAAHRAIPPRFKCEYCIRGFFRCDEYNHHVARHENIENKKQYLCDHCERGFVGKRNLISHLKVHDDLHVDLAKHSCIFCSARFSEARLLHYHIKKKHLKKEQDGTPLHLKKKLNETWVETVQNTSNCVEITKVKSNVLVIKKYITKSKKDLVTSTDVNMHLQFKASEISTNNTHYSNVICDYCKKEMLKKSIVKHITEAHLKLKKFECNICKKRFNRNYQLLYHSCDIQEEVTSKIKKKVTSKIQKKVTSKSEKKVKGKVQKKVTGKVQKKVISKKEKKVIGRKQKK